MHDWESLSHYFKKEFGSFYFMQRGNIVYMADEVAVLVDHDPNAEMSTLLKHGPVDAVRDYFATMRKRYHETGMDQFLEHVIMVESGEWDPDDLNKFIHISGYIGTYLNEKAPREDPANPDPDLP